MSALIEFFLGTAIALLLQQLQALFEAFRAGKLAPLPPLAPGIAPSAGRAPSSREHHKSPRRIGFRRTRARALPKARARIPANAPMARAQPWQQLRLAPRSPSHARCS